MHLKMEHWKPMEAKDVEERKTDHHGWVGGGAKRCSQGKTNQS